MVEITNEQFNALAKKVEELEKKVKRDGKKDRKDKPKKPPSAYNKFVGEMIKELKKDPENKDKAHTEVFSMAVAAWNENKKKVAAEAEVEAK